MEYGGDEGTRTPGLYVANVLLSHLSYIPTSTETFEKRSLLHQLGVWLSLRKRGAPTNETFGMSWYRSANYKHSDFKINDIQGKNQNHLTFDKGMLKGQSMPP